MREGCRLSDKDHASGQGHAELSPSADRPLLRLTSLARKLARRTGKMPRWSAERRAPCVTGRGNASREVFWRAAHGTHAVRRSAPSVSRRSHPLAVRRGAHPLAAGEGTPPRSCEGNSSHCLAALPPGGEAMTRARLWRATTARASRARRGARLAHRAHFYETHKGGCTSRPPRGQRHTAPTWGRWKRLSSRQPTSR